MESDKFITVCDGSGLAIVDLSNRDSVIKLPMSAEAAIMNPVTNVLALRGTDARIALGGGGHVIDDSTRLSFTTLSDGKVLQIYDRELNAKMKSHTMTSQVVYWRWTSPTNIALVTPTSVFHWSVDVHSYEPAKAKWSTSSPVKTFSVLRIRSTLN